MHSTDKQLRSLLCDDETSHELLPIVQHVEGCERCRGRLEQLTGLGNWTTELVDTLRDDALDTGADSADRDDTPSRPGITVVLDQGAELDDANIEFDAVPLDFLTPPSHPELLGRLGRYDIERVIGAGGMGLVLKGFDGELHRPVAIKVLAPHLAHSAAARKRFAREAQATAAVIHPHVIPIHNVETSDKLPYLVMNYINGSSLQWHVDTHGPLNTEETLRIALQTVAGMRAAHEQGLIHRDVKPANILLEEGTLRVVLSDFGLARTMDDASLTRTGIVTGTPHYMSPEQAGGDAIDSRSDLFSLGCVLYFMLTGRPPFRAATAMGVLNRICHEQHRPVREVNSLVPRPLADIVDRLLAKRADDRFASAEKLEQALTDVMRALQEGRLKLPKERKSMRAVVSQQSIRWSRELAAFAIVLLIALPIVFRRPLVDVINGFLGLGRSPAEIYRQPPPPQRVSLDEWQQGLIELGGKVNELEQRDGSTIRLLQQLSQQANRDLDQLEAELKKLEQHEQAARSLLDKP
jgi:serine/threonine protein kinase